MPDRPAPMMMASKSGIVVAPMPVVLSRELPSGGLPSGYPLSRRGTNPAWTRGRVAGLPPANSGRLYSRPHLPLSSGFRSPERRRRHEGRQAMAQALQRRLTSIDVSDPHLYQDDTWRPLFEQLRRDDPVHYCEASPFGPYWSVTRYDDIFAVELDHENYSSSSELGGIQVADQPKGQERTSFIRMDPPGHTAQRRTVAPIVAPSNLANFEPLIRKRTSRRAGCLAAQRDLRLGRARLDRSHQHDAGDAVRFPLGRSHEAELVVRCRDRQCRFARCRRAFGGRAFRRDGEDGRVFPQIVECARRCPADLRPGLDAGAFAEPRETCRRASSSARSGC